MDASDMFVNDLIYYKEIKQNDIEKQIITNSVHPKIINLPLKKRSLKKTKTETKTSLKTKTETNNPLRKPSTKTSQPASA